MWHGKPRVADAALKSEMNLGRTAFGQVRSDSGREGLFANRRQGEEVRFLAFSPTDFPIGSPKNEAGLLTECAHCRLKIPSCHFIASHLFL